MTILGETAGTLPALRHVALARRAIPDPFGIVVHVEMRYLGVLRITQDVRMDVGKVGDIDGVLDGPPG